VNDVRYLLSGIRTRIDRLTEKIERQQSPEGVDWDQLVAKLKEARRRNAAGIQPPQLTADEFTVWAERLRASARSRDDVVLVERLISGSE
jgi:hypothetical protein